MVSSNIPYGKQPSRIGSSPSSASQQTFLRPRPRPTSTRSIASSGAPASRPDTPLGREQRAELTRQLDRLHQRYFDLCETDEQRHDLRSLMRRTTDHLAANGFGWDRLKQYFDFNQTMENTRCAMGGVGNATLFAVGGLFADLYAPEPLAAALDRLGVDSSSKVAAIGAMIGTGVLWADGVLSPPIVRGMRGPGYVPSDSVRPGSSRYAPPRFVREFQAAAEALPLQSRATATAQLRRSLGPYTVRNQGLIGLYPALRFAGVSGADADKVAPFAQNMLGLAAGATGALLVASDERKTGHRSPLAYLYRQPVDDQNPLDALTTAIRRVEGKSLLAEQVVQVGKDLLGAALAVPTALVVPPVLAATRFGGVSINDPNFGILQKFVPEAVQNLVSPKSWAPAAVFSLGSAALSFVNSKVVHPAAQVLTGSEPSTPGDAKRNDIVASAMRDTTTAVVKKRLYNALASAAVGTSVATDKVKNVLGECVIAERPDEGTAPINAGGASVAAIDTRGDVPMHAVAVHGSRGRMNFDSQSGRSSIDMPSSIGSQDSLFRPRTPRSPPSHFRFPNTAASTSASPNAASSFELRRLEPRPVPSATKSV
ncbi:MAG: hypothetical protein JWQ11_3459 [Rhizobacter sp.]|nr:hypothetical protein [Rhizobacter sp.]